MLNKYINTAIGQAKYEFIEDNGEYYGEIPVCRAVYASATTIEECRTLLIEILQEWIVIRLKQNLQISF